MSTTGEQVAGGCLALIAFVVVLLVSYGWLIMLSVGILHSVFNWPDGTISFWQGVALAIPFMLISGLFSRGTRS